MGEVAKQRRSSLCAADGVEEKTVTGRVFSKLEEQRMNHFVIAHHCFLSRPELCNPRPGWCCVVCTWLPLSALLILMQLRPLVSLK